MKKALYGKTFFVTKLYLLLLVLGLVSCSKTEEDQEHTVVDAAKATATTATVFNIEQVKKEYGDTALTILDISERSRDGRNRLAVTFSVPLNPADDHQQFFRVSQQQQVVDGRWVLADSGKVAWFTNIEPNTEYTVTVYSGLKAANQQSLLSDASEKLTTRALNPSINFETTGAFLTQGIGNGLPVTAVNINAVDIDFFRVKTQQVRQFLTKARRIHRYPWQMDEITRHADLTYSARFDLDIPNNTRTQRTINIEGISELSDPGIYIAIMRAAGTYQKAQMLWFAVTDIGLHARLYEQQLDIYASSLTTGKPMRDLTVSAYDSNNQLLQEAFSDNNGLASLPLSDQKIALVIASNANSYSIIDLQKPALDLSAFDLGKRPQLPNEFFLYLPRDIFRPGESIDISGLLRSGDGKRTAESVLTLTIKRPDGTEASQLRWQPQTSDYYYRHWQIPNDAPLGKWQLIVSGALKQPVTYAFNVEDFLPERLKLSFQPTLKAAAYSAQQTIEIDTHGEYLYGAPAAGNRLSSYVSVSPWRQPLASHKDYYFGKETETNLNQRFDVNDVVLNDQGKVRLKLNSRWQKTQSPLKIKLTASLYETGGRPVTRQYSQLVWPHKTLIGIRPHFNLDKNPEPNSQVSFDIVSVTAEGKQQPAKNLSVQLIREDRQYFWVYNEDQGWHYEWTEKDLVEFTRSSRIDADSPTTVSFPVEWGRYRIAVTDHSTGAVSNLRFYAGHNWYSDWQQSQNATAARPDRITLALDKAHYRNGETAKLRVVAPEAGEALIIVEGDQPLWLKRIAIPASGATIDIPIEKHWQQHNLYISAVVFRPGEMKASITPKRSVGLIHLPLDRSLRKFDVNIDIPEKALPEKTLTVPIQVSTQTGTLPKAIKLTLAAVDVGVLAVSDFTTPDPFEAFFGQRRYGIDSYDMYAKVIEASNADNASLRYGGDTDLARGGKKPISDVQIVSLFSGLVDVDDSGKAQIKLALPDFNGRVRLMAIAFSDEHFGSNEAEITVAAPVVTQLSMPRFLAMGDSATLALDVTNLSAQTQPLNVALHTRDTDNNPITLTQKATGTLSLADGEKTTLLYNVKANNYTGSAIFNLEVTGENIETIERKWSLGVRPPYPAIIKRRQEILEPGDELSISNIDIYNLLPDTAQAKLSIANYPDMQLGDQLQHLLQYPYGCLEQTSSRLFPLLYANEKRQQAFQLQPLTAVERNKRIEQGLERLGHLQLPNGGFSLWHNKGREEHWLSAYVGDLLVSAKEEGFEIPENLYRKTMKRLHQYVNSTGRFMHERWSEAPTHYTFAYKAYAGYVLARVNQAPLGSLRHLYDHQFSQAKTGLAQLHLGLALHLMGDHKRGRKAIDQAVAFKPAKRPYLGDYGSQERDTALMVYLLTQHKFAQSERLGLSVGLADDLRSRRWLSTQERNGLFLAGIALGSDQQTPWQAVLTVGEKNEPLNITGFWQRLFAEQHIVQTLSIKSLNADPLFITSEISGYSTQAPAEQRAGLSIYRQWFDTKGQPVNPQQVAVGDLILVHLEVEAEQRTPDGLIIDLLPAGFELENQNLNHAASLGDFTIEGKTIGELVDSGAIQFQEYRDDRFVAAVDLPYQQSQSLVYLMRAVTPGTFKVPAPLAEDMYQPERRAIGKTLTSVTITNPHSAGIR